MLKVILNQCNNNTLKGIIDNETLLINDVEIYKILNNEKKFNSKNYSLIEMRDLVSDITKMSKEKNIVIHTFNPQLLNWFDEEIAKESFSFIDKENKLQNIFSYKNGEIINKLIEDFNITKTEIEEYLGPGEIMSILLGNIDLSKL